MSVVIEDPEGAYGQGCAVAVADDDDLGIGVVIQVGDRWPVPIPGPQRRG